MTKTASTMLELGTAAIDFRLPATTGREYGLGDFDSAQVLVIMFICNHCPYVKHIQQKLVEVTNSYMQRGVAFVGINANDPDSHPEDSPGLMVEEAARQGYAFPYLFDASQKVAKDYRAACTPEFYVFDRARELAYRGQFDDSRPSNGVPVTGADLSAALDALLEGRPVAAEQKPSIGCNIKWRPGNAPAYA